MQPGGARRRERSLTPGLGCGSACPVSVLTGTHPARVVSAGIRLVRRNVALSASPMPICGLLSSKM